MRTIKLLCFLSLWITSPIYAKSITLGIAEESLSEQSPFHARILFKQTTSGWMALNSKNIYQNANMDTEQLWTIVFDGKNLGQMTTIDTDERYPDCVSCFPRDKVSTLKDINEFPRIINKGKRFQNWSFLPENRPVVLNSHPFYKDPDVWKRQRHSNDLLSVIYPKMYKILNGSTFHCNHESKVDSSEFPLSLDDIDVLKVYSNINNDIIVSAALAEKHLENCDGPPSEITSPIWFYIKKSNVTLIGYELDLVEAGDFDNDGEVEFIFSHSGYNRDGYSLFESDFTSRYDYFWKYH